MASIVADLVQSKNEMANSYKVKIVMENELSLRKVSVSKIEVAK